MLLSRAMKVKYLKLLLLEHAGVAASTGLPVSGCTTKICFAGAMQP